MVKKANRLFHGNIPKGVIFVLRPFNATFGLIIELSRNRERKSGAGVQIIFFECLVLSGKPWLCGGRS